MEIPVERRAAAPEPSPEPQPAAEARNEAAPVEPGVQRADAAPTRGRLAKAAIDQTVAERQGRFAACYGAALATDPALRGTILVNFVVAPDGTVPYAAALEAGTDLPNDRVIDCVLEEFQALVFPKPTGGRAVATYPLAFAPGTGTSAPARP